MNFCRIWFWTSTQRVCFKSIMKKSKMFNNLLLLKYLLSALIVFWATDTALAQDKERIVLAGDEWCPYNCHPASENPGYMVEIAREVFGQQGYEVVYRVTSWNRAIFGTRNGDYDGIIGTGKEETPDLIFPRNELGVAAHTFYVQDTTQWQFRGYQSLDKMTVGVIENYSYGTFFNDYIVPNRGDAQKVQVITGSDPFARNLQKMKLGRINATIEDKNVMDYHVRNSLEDLGIKTAGILTTEKIYIAFSNINEKSKEYAKILDEGVEQLRESGKLDEILQKYGLTDWKKPSEGPNAKY